MKKNFTAIPNNEFLEIENKYNLNSTLEYILIKMRGMADKFGQGFQKSQADMAKICRMSKSTFIRQSEELINRGFIAKKVVYLDKKNAESCYWTVNIEYTFEEYDLSTTTVQNENTHIQNDNGVLSDWQGGIVNMTKKEEGFKISFKDFKEGGYNKGSQFQIERFKQLIKDNTFDILQTLLNQKGVQRGIIEDIKERMAFEIAFNKSLTTLYANREKTINKIINDLSKEKNIYSFSALFVHRYVEDINKIMLSLNKQNEEEEEENTPTTVPFYNWLDAK
jgi:DNA-binding Lrp family transcriptional regulator